MRNLAVMSVTLLIACSSPTHSVIDGLPDSSMARGPSPQRPTHGFPNANLDMDEALDNEVAVATTAERKVLIYGPTFGGSHDLVGTAPNTRITIWDAATWASKNTKDFSAFDAIVFGDFPDGSSDCFADPTIWLTAILTRSQWQPAITGNIVVLGTDPEFHRKDQLIHQAVEFVANDRDAGPGLYVALSCAFQFAPNATPILLLEGIGDFRTRSTGCGNQAVKIAPHQVLTSITDEYLSNWSCSTHNGFDSWPDTFVPLAIVTDAPDPNFTSSKGITGVVYVLISAIPRNRWRPAIPGEFFVSGLNWSMNGSISANDGLVLTNITLGSRYMANMISLPYFNLTTTKFGPERLELDATGRGKASKLVGFIISHLEDRLRIEATYKFDKLPKGSKSQLFVTQRYEFFIEIDEKTDSYHACEPSQESFPVNIISSGIPCARFRPIVEYTFAGQDGEEIVSLSTVQRLHFTPDQTNLQASVFIHDCTKNESGTDDEPCLYTLPPFGTFTIPGSIFSGSIAPGVKLKDNQNPITREALEPVVLSGFLKGAWDNVHLTTARSVLLPVPIPPGCPECVHIHWRWAADFGKHFGNGLPMIHNDVVTDPFARPTSTNPHSLQDVHVALTVAHPGEEDPRDFSTLVTPAETLQSPLGQVLWYSATSHGLPDSPPVHDEFFNHGGFFSTLGGPADLETRQALLAPTETHAGDQIHVRILVNNFGPKEATGVTVVDALPIGAVFDDANTFDGIVERPCIYNSGFVGCTFEFPIGTTAVRVDLHFHMPSAGPAVNHALVMSSGNSDPNSGNNLSELTVNVLP